MAFFCTTPCKTCTQMSIKNGPLRCYLSPRKSTPNSKGEVPIILHLVRMNDSRMRLKTGYWIKPENWDFQKEKVKPMAFGAMEMNILLGRVLEGAQLLCLNSTIDGKEVRKEIIEQQVLGRVREPNSGNFNPAEYIRDFVAKQTNNLSRPTLSNYLTLAKHLEAYCQASKQKLSYSLFNHDFAHRFLAYLTAKQIGNNTANKYLKRLKTILKKAHMDGLLESRAFEEYQNLKEHVDFIYLTSEELDRLKELDLSKSPELEKARDTFLFQCGCGLRYSDILALTWDDVKKDHLLITTQKTHQEIRIPINTITRPLLDKYDGYERPIPAYCNQAQNRYLKQIGALAGLYERHNKVRFFGKDRIQTRQHKWELLSTHTARRTFVILALERGMRPEVLMRITGHRKLSTLQRYISITDNVVEQEMKMAFG